MAVNVLYGDALALGLASGPACLAACGPVLVPSLLAGPQGILPNLRAIAIFLSTRLVGYLLFAVVAWQAGALTSMLVKPHPHLVGLVYLVMAVVLGWYAYVAKRKCTGACAGPKLVNIGGIDTSETAAGAKSGVAGVAMLGFLTGLNFCPPFVVAGIRAAQLGSLTGALVFFGVFFAGTSIWFVPFAGFGYVVRNEALITVARMTMGLVAFYYTALGIYMMFGS
jgi:hypothetical protein